ncbi:MAG: HIT domain-containing protein [Rickettsiaceae bacterium H1]|nr:HIT domain-containing protein [Rickettsiaceae bacterium H1]
MFDNYDANNVFYKIIRGSASCNKVHEDEKVLAFHDINPVSPVHILVIPKEKYTSFHDFLEKSPDVNHFFSVVRKIADDRNLTKNGYRIVTNHGKDGGQIIPHFHVHILGGKKLGGIG